MFMYVVVYTHWPSLKKGGDVQLDMPHSTNTSRSRGDFCVTRPQMWYRTGSTFGGRTPAGEYLLSTE